MIQFYNRHAEPLPEDINICANELYDGKHYPVEGKLFIGLGFVFHHAPGGSEMWHNIANGKYESFYGADQTEKDESADNSSKPVKLSFYKHSQHLVNLQVDINRALWASNLQYAKVQNRFNSDQERDEYIIQCLSSAMTTLTEILSNVYFEK